MILMSSIIFLIIVPNNEAVTLIIIRVLLGLAVGAIAAPVPSYMSEIAPANIRVSIQV